MSGLVKESYVVESARETFSSGLLSRAPTRLADEIAEVLRRLILQGELRPGQQLLQIQLAERLGVSRTPLREAFRLLEQDGLLRISNGNKTVEVVDVDPEKLIETYQVREVIDGLAARLAARQGLSEAASRRLELSMDRMAAAADRTGGPDLAEYGVAHADFHLSVGAESGNSRLHEFESLVRVSTQIQLTRYLQRGGDDRSDVVRRVIEADRRQHREILVAIAQRDSAAAERAAERHIAATVELLQILVDDDRAKSERRAIG
ncbi:GntR family transcriptional regulator [Nocardia sp. NPDC052278]|uniref:GntR family transcriptional regulator n=1 Tax=unclassified Nocardia TaxID=2637762 RepID=UPI0036CDC74A